MFFFGLGNVISIFPLFLSLLSFLKIFSGSDGRDGKERKDWKKERKVFREFLYLSFPAVLQQQAFIFSQGTTAFIIFNFGSWLSTYLYYCVSASIAFLTLPAIVLFELFFGFGERGKQKNKTEFSVRTCYWAWFYNNRGDSKNARSVFLAFWENSMYLKPASKWIMAAKMI